MTKRAVDKTYNLAVENEGQTVNKTFLLDKNVKVVTGLALSASDPRLLFYRGTQRIEISGDELFPEGFESKILMSGLSVAPDQKYRSLGNGVIPGNGEIKVQYKDETNPNAPFTPYKVTFIFLCEMK